MQKTYEIVIEDFKALIGNTDSERIKIFIGKMDGNKFHFFSEGRRLPAPELLGTIKYKNENSTEIEVKVKLSKFDCFINLFWIIFFVYKLNYIENWINLPLLFKILIIVSCPIISIIHYIYRLKNMLEDIELYIEGHYDKYIK